MGIMNREGALYMATGVDNSGLYSGLNQAEGRIDQFGNHISAMGDKITKLTGIGFGIAGLKAFGSEIINVRGEIQMLESSFEVLLGGKGVSGFMSEMKQFAVDSPLSMNGVANAAQTLLGFGISAEKVMPTIKQIGDISMGNEERFKSLSLAFAQMSATGKLMGQDLLQMINAGFNPLQTISEKTGKSIGDLKKEMEGGAISSEMVADAFASATAEGGKFYGMTQKQAEGIRGLQAQLEGGLQDAFNSMGKSAEGAISIGYKGAISLVENYEKVGKVLLALIATYGAYRAAVVLNTVAESGWTIAQMTQYKWLLLVEKAQRLLNATMLKNPYVLAATLIIGVVTAMWALRDSISAAEKAQADYNKRKEEAIQKEQDHKSKIEELINAATNQALADLQRVDALETLKQKYPQIFAKYDIELLKLADILSIKKQIAEQDGKDAVQSRKNQYEEALNRQKQAEERYNKVVKEYGGSINYQGVINDAKLRLTKANEELKLYEKDVQTDRINTFISGIDKMSKKQIEVELQARQQLEHNLKQSGKTGGVISGGLLEGTFSKDQLKQQTTALETELNKRNQARFNYVDLEKKYNSELKILQEERTRIEKDSQKLTPQELKKKIEDVDAKIKAKEEELKNLTGKTTKQQESEANKAETAAEKARKASQKALDDQLKLDNDKAKALLDARNTQLENDQAMLDLQEDSFNKQQEQLKINHQKELLAIDRRTQELIERKQEAERKQWDLDNPNGSKTPFTPKTLTIANLSASDQADLAASTIIASKTHEKATADLLKSLLEKYQDYNTQRAEANKQFDAEEKALNASRNAENETEIDAALAVLIKKRKEALKAISEAEANETKKSSDLFIRLFTESSQQSVSQIRKVIEETQALYNYLSTTKDEDITDNLGFTADQLRSFKGNAEELKAVLDGLIAKKKDLAGRSEFDSFMLGISDGLKKIKKGGTENIGQGITDIGNAATAMMPSIEKFGQDLGAIFGSDTADDISVITDLLGATVEVGTGVGKIMSGDVVGGIKDVVSGVAKVFSMASAANERHREALKLIEAAAKAQEHAYQLALRLQSLAYEQGNTIFGDDPYGKAINGAIEYRNAIEDLNQSLKGDGIVKPKSVSAFFQKLSKGNLGVLPQESNIAALQNIEIVTGHKKTGLFGWGKGKDTYSGILEVYPQLIDQQGEFNVELAKTVIAERSMSDENKVALQYMIDNAESVKEAYAVMKDYLTDIFGDLGSSMTDALVNSFLKGEDAAKSFYDTASGFIQNLVKDMINAAVIAPVIKKATEDAMSIMEDTSLSDKERMEKLMLVVDDILTKGLDAQDQAKDLYDYSNEKWKEITGKDLFVNDDSSSSQSPSKGGYETMSQDTATALEGRFTAIQMSMINVEAYILTLLSISTDSNATMKALASNFQEIRNIVLDMMYNIQDINKNTKELYEINSEIKGMSRKLDSL